MADLWTPSKTGALYKANAARWQLELDSSEWTLDTVGSYVAAFPAEHATDLAYRRSMCCPLDMCRDGVRIRVDNLWRTPPKREAEGKHKTIIEELIHDADGDGTPLDKFMQGVCWDHYVTGVDIVTQLSRSDTPVRTLADEQAAGLRPYFLRFTPLQRNDWATNGAGGFTWARYCLGSQQAADEQGGDPGVTEYLTLTPNLWRLWKVTKDEDGKEVATMIGEGPHSLGMTPIVKLYYSESRKPGNGGVPLSLLTRPSVVAKVLLNIKSQADADLIASVTRWIATGLSKDDLPTEYGPGMFVAFPDNVSVGVYQGDVHHIVEKREWVTLYIAEILRLLKFRGGMAEITANSGSGLKLAMERTDLENELRSTAGQMEAVELEMMRQAVSLRTGKTIPQDVAADALGYSVAYNKDYDLSPIGEVLDNIKVWLSDCSFASEDVPEIGREMMRQLANMLTREGSPAYTAAMEQIEAAALTGAEPLGTTVE